MIFSSLFNILAGTIANLGYQLCLFFDGLIYKLVAYSFNLFMIVCQINLTNLSSIVAPLINRIEAVIIVLVVFKLGTSLVSLMINPDKAPNIGKKFIINIFICAALLVSYNFIFSIFNDVGMLILGKPDGASFSVLDQIADLDDSADEGLIMRFIFGSDNTAASDSENLGMNVAVNTLGIFLHDTDSTTYSRLITTIQSGDSYDFDKVTNMVQYIGKGVTYIFLLSGLMGIYLIYSIAKAAIEVGVRMFKMLALQILAPIAIISIISEEGTKSKVFKNYIDIYTKTFISAFTRVVSILVTTVFVCKFFTSIGQFFEGITETTSGITKMLVSIIAVVAGYQFAGEFPKFIDSILGTKMAGDGKGGIGGFLKGALGIGAGALIGGASGLAAGINNGAGVMGSIGNMVSGQFSGGAAGLKGNKIADKIKNISAANGKNASRAQNIAAAGGLGAYMGGKFDNAMSRGKRQDAQVARFDRESSSVDEQLKLVNDYEAAQREAIKDFKLNDATNGLSTTEATNYVSGYEDTKFGDNKDNFVNTMIDYDSRVVNAKAKLEEAKNSGVAVNIENAERDLIAATTQARSTASTIYDTHKAAATGDNVDRKRKAAKDAGLKVGSESDIKKTKNDLRDRKYAIENDKGDLQRSGAYKRAHNPATKK